ncbi:ATP-binding mismatch repair protein [Rhodotorula toruloides]
MVGSLFEEIRARAVEIRVAATGVRRAGNRLTAIDKQFILVFQTEMKQFTGEYVKKLKKPQKTAIVQELEQAEKEARRLKANGYSAEQILEDLQELPPFEPQSDEHHPSAHESSGDVRLYERTGQTPAPTDLIDPHDLYTGGGVQHSLAKQQRERNEVPGYGESWTARKAAIYGSPAYPNGARNTADTLARTRLSFAKQAAIDKSSVHRLTSGQVVIDLQSAVKELVENALDAGATKIEVRFRDYGLEAFEVLDNGKGIVKDDWPSIALKHHTSKLASFDELASVSTLGFRGEALSSLCGVATLSMITSTSSKPPIGTSLTFAHSGECVVGGKVARERGTTVKVERLFDTLPVRRKELVKNVKREFGKAIELINSYAIINTGVRFDVRNTAKGKTQTHLQTPTSSSIRSNYASIFAAKDLASLIDFDLTLEVPTDKSILKRIEGAMEATTLIKVKGMISKPAAPHGRTTSNRQFFYVNGRPFSPSKIAKTVNEVYKSYNSNQFPIVVADFQLAPDAYDVNVSPDKRTIFLHSETNLIRALKEQLAKFFEPQHGTFAMQAIGPAKGKEKVQEPEDAGVVVKEEEDDLALSEGRPRKRRKDSHAPSSDLDPPPRVATPVERTAPSTSSDSRRSISVTPVVDPFPTLPGEEVILPTPPPDFAHPPPTSSANDAGADSNLPATPERQSPPLADPPPESSTAALFLPPSPTPHPPSPSPNSSRRRASPSPAPRPSPAPSRNLKQPTLPFAPARAAAGGSRGSRGTRSTGVGKVEPGARMKGMLQKFLRGSQAQAQGEANVDADSADGQENDEREEKDEIEDDEADAEMAEGEEDGQDEAQIERDELAADVHEPAQSCRHEAERKDDSGKVDDSGAADEAAEEHIEDVVLVVEDSFNAASPPATAVDDDDFEIVSASCICVHGSQDSDIEIQEDTSTSARPPSAAAAQVALHDIPLPFGAAPAEVAGTVIAADADLDVDFDALEARWTASEPLRQGSPARASADGERDDGALAGAGVDEQEDVAEATLSRVVSKQDFEAMEVVGQFNLGFIIARRKVVADAVDGDGEPDVHDDLFIIDQHASDEKYNFERLQAETVIQSQRLLAPRSLGLPSADEITAMEHLDLLRLNGYDVAIDEDAQIGERVKLVAQPVSKETVFDVGDFEELIHLIESRGGGEVVRPSKARRMFASRACRKSVMIGKALSASQMTSIIRHMGGMDQPWACPHGRPTMRWLASLNAAASPRDPRSDLAQLVAAYE